MKSRGNFASFFLKLSETDRFVFQTN